MISGGGQVGQQLSCSTGEWSPGDVAAFLYRGVRKFAYQWSRGATEIDGAVKSTFTPDTPGNYSCRVTGKNAAGSTSQTSAGRQIKPSNAFTFGQVKKNKKRGTAKLQVRVPGAGELELAGTKKLKGASATAEDAGKVKLPVKAKGKARKKLRKKGKAKVKAAVTFTPNGGDPNTEKESLALIKR